MTDPAALPSGPGVYCLWLGNGGAYVGKTLSSIRGRVMAHIRASQREKKPQVVHVAIAKHGCTRIDVVMEGGSADDVSACEVATIHRMKAEGVKLYNLTDGGDGKPGFKWASDTREKIVPALKASWTDARKDIARKRQSDPTFRARVSSAQKASWSEEKRKAQRDRLRDNAPARKLTRSDVETIADMLRSGKSCASIGRAYGVTPEAISAIKTGKNWSYVTGF